MDTIVIYVSFMEHSSFAQREHVILLFLTRGDTMVTVGQQTMLRRLHPARLLHCYVGLCVVIDCEASPSTFQPT